MSSKPLSPTSSIADDAEKFLQNVQSSYRQALQEAQRRGIPSDVFAASVQHAHNISQNIPEASGSYGTGNSQTPSPSLSSGENFSSSSQPPNDSQSMSAARSLSKEELDRLTRAEVAAQLRQALNNLFPLSQILFTQLGSMAHEWNKLQGFWESDNIGEKIALLHSEVSEFLEYYRQSPTDAPAYPSDHLPGLPGIHEEAADILFRLMDLCAHLHINLAEAFIAKFQYNLTRPFKHNKEF